MGKSPGHRDHPEHHVSVRQAVEHIEVKADGRTLAASDNVLVVEEDDVPARFYFPRRDVSMEILKPSANVTRCPFKGTAHYYDVTIHGRKVQDAAWSYEDPYDEHAGLTGRLAFDPDKAELLLMPGPGAPAP